jgi:hypothetical protein
MLMGNFTNAIDSSEGLFFCPSFTVTGAGAVAAEMASSRPGWRYFIGGVEFARQQSLEKRHISQYADAKAGAERHQLNLDGA